VKSERAWAGIICGFFLFIVVCLSLLLHMKGAFRATGHPELGCSSFCCPVRRPAASLPGSGYCVRLWRDAGCTCLSGDDAAFFVTERTFWQELAWLFSAVFWCALGALCFLFICAWLDTRRSHSSEE
jgi:hypothetical protein